MRLTKEALSTKVVVRRAKRGFGAFVWEINRDSMAEPVYVSPETFRSMEAAYTAGQARLPEFIPVHQSLPEILEDDKTLEASDDLEADDAMAFIEQSHAPANAAWPCLGQSGAAATV